MDSSSHGIILYECVLHESTYTFLILTLTYELIKTYDYLESELLNYL